MRASDWCIANTCTALRFSRCHTEAYFMKLPATEIHIWMQPRMAQYIRYKCKRVHIVTCLTHVRAVCRSLLDFSLKAAYASYKTNAKRRRQTKGGGKHDDESEGGGAGSRPGTPGNSSRPGSPIGSRPGTPGCRPSSPDNTRRVGQRYDM